MISQLYFGLLIVTTTISITYSNTQITVRCEDDSSLRQAYNLHQHLLLFSELSQKSLDDREFLCLATIGMLLLEDKLILSGSGSKPSTLTPVCANSL